MPLTWSEVQRKKPLYLNLGGKGDCHTKRGYEHYISVDLQGEGEWMIRHDLTKPIPLPDSCVDRIHTEDSLHYLEQVDAEKLLRECHRILKPGGFLRIGLPDYLNPKDQPCLQKGTDPRHPRHLWLPHHKLLHEILQRSPFERFEFYHYWDGDTFVKKEIDYSSGMIRRTPDNDERCKKAGPRGWIHNLHYLLSHIHSIPKIDLTSLRGRPLHITSLIVDCYKD